MNKEDRLKERQFESRPRFLDGKSLYLPAWLSNPASVLVCKGTYTTEGELYSLAAGQQRGDAFDLQLSHPPLFSFSFALIF